MLVYGSVCSGIEAASLAWEPLGWRPAFFSEIEAFPRAVLRHRYPAVPLHGDFTTIEADHYEAIDVLVGGTPCQDFSAAGLRAGLAGDRGNLSLQFLALARRLRPRWVVWENVPGVLSIDGGRAFGAVLGGLGQLGYGFAYRVLDAQFFGVPQRRRRVFVVGYLGDWRRAAAVLFERACLSGHPPPSREAGATVAPTIASGSGGRSVGRDVDTADGLIADALSAAGARSNRSNGVTLVGALSPGAKPGTYNGQDAYSGHLIAFDARQSHAIVYGDKAGPLDTLGYSQAVAFGGNNTAGPIDVATARNAHSGPHGRLDFETETFVRQAAGVRRLTPRECERLQGMPDDWTLVPVGKRGKPAKDGPRYAAIGNSMAVPCMRWIGERIAMVDAL